jgi:hypothetical protein
MGQPSRKLQLSNGYPLEFGQLSRVLHFLKEHAAEKRIYRKAILENTGLSDRQIESVVSIGCALGIIKPTVQTLTPIGALIAANDILLEKIGTLQWCHFKGAGNPRNLVWYEIFNSLLPSERTATEAEWLADLRSAVSEQYTDRTVGQHLHEEVRFVVDAYLNRNFKKLEILHQSADGLLFRKRRFDVVPAVFCAMIYDYAASRGENLLQVREVGEAKGAPPFLFGFDETTFRQSIEFLHENGWLRYESTHNLDQVRLRDGLSALSLLKSYYESPTPEHK